MRSEAEIVAFMRKQDDVLGFAKEVLIPYLSLEAAKEFLGESQHHHMPRIWADGKWPRKQVPEEIAKEAQQYMEFAWDKVVNHRGISASRSVEKMKAWMFLLGHDELVSICDSDESYPQYGAPILYTICQNLGWSWPSNNPLAHEMAMGRKCTPDCEMGCAAGVGA